MIKAIRVSLALLSLSAVVSSFADETEAIEFFESKGARVTVVDGKATKIMHGGKPALTVAELNRLAELPNLEQVALNMPPAGDEGWEFLSKIPKLNRFTVWHGKEFSSLAPFCGLPVETITFGGCMGIRDLNKETPEKQRDVSLSLKNLPNLKSLTLYHSPLTPDDSHLAHIVSEFPNLTELRIDFAAPRGSEINISKAGIENLSNLKLEKLGIENAEGFGPDVFAAIGKISTLKELVIHPNRKDREGSIATHEALLKPVKAALPELKVTYFGAPKKK